MTARGWSRGAGLTAAAALVLAQVDVKAATCPDPAIVQSARLVEFQTMMMDVTVRCNHVGVPIGEHLTDMSTRHGKQFSQAHDQVAAFLRSSAADPAPPLPPAKLPSADTGSPRPKAAKAKPAKLAQAAPAAPTPAAKLNRRTDPYDLYLTKIGNQYGAGATSVQRCKMFDTIAVTLADKSSSSRMLGIVSKSLVTETLLEAILKCAPAK